jgi:hypothetical protein
MCSLLVAAEVLETQASEALLVAEVQAESCKPQAHFSKAERTLLLSALAVPQLPL